MFVIREVLNCKPGKVRPMVENFQALARVAQEIGRVHDFRIMTDVSGEPFWTVVSELTVDSIEGFFELERTLTSHESIQKRMANYHDLIESGRREIYRVQESVRDV